MAKFRPVRQRGRRAFQVPRPVAPVFVAEPQFWHRQTISVGLESGDDRAELERDRPADWDAGIGRRCRRATRAEPGTSMERDRTVQRQPRSARRRRCGSLSSGERSPPLRKPGRHVVSARDHGRKVAVTRTRSRRWPGLRPELAADLPALTAETGWWSGSVGPGTAMSSTATSM